MTNKFFTSFLLLLLVQVQIAFAQCVNPSSIVTSTGTGNWDDCLRWSGVSCTGWATATIMGNRTQVILSGHTISVPSTISTYHARSKGIVIHSGGTLNMTGSVNGRLYLADKIQVCGVLNVQAGTQDFETAELIINNGGVVNINAGQLRMNKITVKTGGVLNINGSAEINRKLGTNGLIVEPGGLINVNATTAKLKFTGTGTPDALVNGTIDVKNSMTSTNGLNVHLGFTKVTNGTSTGRIRTQTAFLPSSDATVPTSFSNNFFASNSDYGGTVEYYGTAAINFTLASRYYYYDLEINTSGNVSLHTDTYVRGVLYLKGGNLNTNAKRLFIIGTINYTSTYHIVGGASSEVHFLGKLSTNTLNSPGMTTYLIHSQGVASVNCLNPELRLSAAAGGAATLARLRIDREDLVHLKSNLTVNNELLLNRGILRTQPGSIVYVSNTSPTSVIHFTTGYASTTGFVSGQLRRAVLAGNTYDFPVGYPSLTGTFSTHANKYRRITFDLQTFSGASSLTVDFVPPLPNTCASALTTLDEGVLYQSLHPEGYWNVVPNATPTSLLYNVKCYIHGFSSPALADNQFGVLKRPSGSLLCADWTTGGGTRNPFGTPGTIKEPTPVDIGFAQRNGLNAFSEFAIGMTDEAIGVGLPIAFLQIQAKQVTADLAEVSWRADQQGFASTYTLFISQNGWEFFPALTEELPAAALINKNVQAPLANYYRLEGKNAQGVFYSPVFTIQKAENEKFIKNSYVQTNLYLWPHTELVSWRVLSMQGREVLNSHSVRQSNDSSIDCADLPLGTYLLEIHTATGLFVERFYKN